MLHEIDRLGVHMSPFDIGPLNSLILDLERKQTDDQHVTLFNCSLVGL